MAVLSGFQILDALDWCVCVRVSVFVWWRESLALSFTVPASPISWSHGLHGFLVLVASWPVTGHGVWVSLYEAAEESHIMNHNSSPLGPLAPSWKTPARAHSFSPGAIKGLLLQMHTLGLMARTATPP